jgi:hypothetical protein
MGGFGKSPLVEEQYTVPAMAAIAVTNQPQALATPQAPVMNPGSLTYISPTIRHFQSVQF